MEEFELAEMLASLEQALTDSGLAVLVTQERLSAVEGKAEKPTSQELDELRYDWSRRSAVRPPRVRVDDVRLRPLTTAERLATLLDLVEAAVGGTYAIEIGLRSDLKAALDTEDVEWNGEVVFADPPESELNGVTSGEWILPDDDSLQQRSAAVREVILLVNRLREQAELTRSDRLHSDAPVSDVSADREIPGDWS